MLLAHQPVLRAARRPSVRRGHPILALVAFLAAAPAEQAPRVETPRTEVSRPATLGAAVPTTTTWAMSDADGVCDVDVALRADGGPWRPLASRADATSIEVRLVAGPTYRFRVGATDCAGRVSRWVAGSAVRLRVVEQDDRAVHYRGRWWTDRQGGYSATAAAVSYAGGATAAIRYTGRAASWVSTTGPDRGAALLYVDGAYAGTVDLHAPGAALRRIVASTPYTTRVRTRTLKVLVVGSPGRPRVDVDAFVVLT